MAAGLNVIPIGGVNNQQSQGFAQALRNLQVGRHAFLAAVSSIVQAVEATGGSTADLGVFYGISTDQAAVLYAQATSFKGHLTAAPIVAAWDQINSTFGIAV